MGPGRIFPCDGCHFRNWLVFFPLQPLLNRILEVRSRYISRCDTGDSIDQTLPFVSQLFVFLPSFFLLFLYFFSRTHPLVDKCVLKRNIVTTIYFERHTYVNLEVTTSKFKWKRNSYNDFISKYRMQKHKFSDQLWKKIRMKISKSGIYKLIK